MKEYRCKVCKERKEAKSYYIIKGKINSRICKACHRNDVSKRYHKNKSREIQAIAMEKACSSCLQIREIALFDKNKSYPDGRTKRCKICINEVRRRRYSKISVEKKKAKRRDNRKYMARYERERCQREPLYRIKRRVSTAIYQAIIKSGGSGKGGSTFKHLPYTPQQLKKHLESQFEPWMSWENYGKKNGCWSIDHIYPQSKLPYDSLEHPNFQKCWALTNLRPIRVEENIKKSNSLFHIDI
tara:strand:- start:1000 stop:1725 length:726 start_codon:yes stop_codon:yes gene_type:complete